jgi:hypothetical protein
MAKSNMIISALLLILLVSASPLKVDTAPKVDNPQAPAEALKRPPLPNPDNVETYEKESIDYYQWNFHKVLKVINAPENEGKKWTHLEVFFHSIELFMTVQPEQYLHAADKFRNDGEESKEHSNLSVLSGCWTIMRIIKGGHPSGTLSKKEFTAFIGFDNMEIWLASLDPLMGEDNKIIDWVPSKETVYDITELMGGGLRTPGYDADL